MTKSGDTLAYSDFYRCIGAGPISDFYNVVPEIQLCFSSVLYSDRFCP